MKDKTKPYIDKALEAIHIAYPEIQDVQLYEDLEIGVDFEDGEPVHIFYSTFYERGQKFGGPLRIVDEREFIEKLIVSTLHHHLKQSDSAYNALSTDDAKDYVQSIVKQIYPF